MMIRLILLIFVSSLLLTTSKEEPVELLYYTSDVIVVTAYSNKTIEVATMLTRIAMGEAIGEGIVGMQAVMEVVLNRTNSSRWPNTVQKVITQRNQFNGYRTKNYNSTINQKVYEIALKLLTKKQDVLLPSNTYYFYNPRIATNQKFITAIRKGKTRVNIGQHEFVY